MKKSLVLSAMLSCFYITAASAIPTMQCPVPGAPLQWQAAYCMYEEGTDDFEAPGIDKCMKKQPHAYNKDHKLDCDDSLRYKLEICKLLASEGFYKTSDSCFKDKKFIPDNVKNNGVD